MEQHPVPQHISSYEFRLVGDMTLKQFGYLAAGTIVALICYGMPLPGYFKWPLILFFGFLGFALAFLPIQERPLSTWLLAFFRAIFAPTQYLWKKEVKRPEIFTPSLRKLSTQQNTRIAPNRGQLDEYLGTLPGEKTTPLEEKETAFLKKINNIYQLAPVMPKSTNQPAWLNQISTTQDKAKPVGLQIGKPYSPFSQPAPFIKTISRTDVAVNWQKTQKPIFAPPKKIQLPPIPTRGNEVFNNERPKEINVVPVPSKKINQTIVEAKTSPHLPIPAPPTQANILVGMVLDTQGNMVEGAILEIRNPEGIPVRALKTNRLGQFLIATPLTNDHYEIETEKEGLKFDIIKIEAKGEIVNPIEIRAKETARHTATAGSLTSGVVGT